jgi:hypothetical protein
MSSPVPLKRDTHSFDLSYIPSCVPAVLDGRDSEPLITGKVSLAMKSGQKCPSWCSRLDAPDDGIRTPKGGRYIEVTEEFEVIDWLVDNSLSV